MAPFSSFEDKRDAFLSFRENAAHILTPSCTTSSFFTNWSDKDLQRSWAREKGMSSNTSIADILLAQIEEHRTEVFYDLDATCMPAGFLTRLPGSVRARIAWHAAPFGRTDFTVYDRVVCNFPSILRTLAAGGARTAYFIPAHDPEMAPYAANTNRTADVVFVGGYSRHHTRRRHLLEAIAAAADELDIRLHLDPSRLCRLAESPIGRLLPLAQHRRPAAIQAVSNSARFGRDLYATFSGAKIVINGALDMAGGDRGNLRCFEATGCGALLLSDEGHYPEGFKPGENFASYTSVEDAMAKLRYFLAAEDERLAMAANGYRMVRDKYSRAVQWDRFEEIIATI